MLEKYGYTKGDLRYFCSIDTTSFNTITGVALSTTTTNGAIYHAAQINPVSFITTTAFFVATLQGTIEKGTPSASTYWFTMGTPLTFTTIVNNIIQNTGQANWTRVNITANTSPCTFKVLMQGQK